MEAKKSEIFVGRFENFGYASRVTATFPKKYPAVSHAEDSASTQYVLVQQSWTSGNSLTRKRLIKTRESPIETSAVYFRPFIESIALTRNAARTAPPRIFRRAFAHLTRLEIDVQIGEEQIELLV